MPKRSDTHETVRLALELLRWIPRKRKVTATELQVQLQEVGFNRDLRTIQRHLEMLSEHFDIECDDRSKPYGYRWKEYAKGFSLPALSEQESLLLTLAEQYLRNLLPAGLMKSMRNFFTQARINLDSPGDTKTRREREWSSKVRVVSTSQPLLSPVIKPGVFEAVSNALYNNCWLEVEYKNASGKQSKNEVMPLGLAQQGPNLYLVCRYRGFDNERSLALHRMILARVLTLTFKRPKEFDLEKYDNDGRFGFGEGERIQLTFRIDKDAGNHLLESPLSKDQAVKERDDYYEITATVVDSEMLKWWLRGFGDQVSHVHRGRVKKTK